MTIWYYVFVFFAGLIAGFINTVAGGGSLLTLPLLIFMGLPPNTANGTNRLAIFMQSISAVAGFKKNNVLNMSEGIQYAIPATIGAIVGAFLAVETKPEILNYFIAGILIVMLFLLLFNPQKRIKPIKNKKTKTNKILLFILFFAIGIYAGFLHASVGFFWLSALVLTAGYDLIKANAVKNFIILLYIPITVLIFAFNGQIDYLLGIILGIGSMIGARLSVMLAVKKGSPVVRYLLLTTIFISALKLLFFP